MAVTVHYPHKHTRGGGMVTVSVPYVSGKRLQQYLKDLDLESLSRVHVTKQGGGGHRLRTAYIPNDGETILIVRVHTGL